MDYKFSKPTTRKGSGVAQFRKRVPTKLLDKAKGKVIQFVVPAKHGVDEWKVNRVVDQFVSFSYNTNDPVLINQRKFIANQKFVDFCNSISTGSVGIDESMIHKYARGAYELTRTEGYDHTGLPSQQKTHAVLMNLDHERVVKLKRIWNNYQRNADVFGISNDIYIETFNVNDLSFDAMNYRVGYLVNWFLCENDITISVDDRTRLVKATDDFARHVYANTLPSDEAKAVAKADPTNNTTLTDIFEKWKSRGTRAINTTTSWVSVIKIFSEFVGHDLADRVTVKDMNNYIAHLQSLGRRPNTINQTHLLCLKCLFTFATDQEMIRVNPTFKLGSVVTEDNGLTREGYSSDEVVKVLRAAEKSTDAAIRWIPWLVATTGSRVNEMTQLHASQVYFDKEFPDVLLIDINKAQKHQHIKNKASYRKVPVLSCIRDEFKAFVDSRKAQYLFIDMPEKWTAKCSPFQSTIHRTRLWVKTIITDHSTKGPFHAFRHHFTTTAFDLDLDNDAVNYIQGHKRVYSNSVYRAQKAKKCLEVIEAVFARLDFTPGQSVVP